MSRRNQISMTPGEVADFLGNQRVLVCATNGRDGWPHLMPLWYLVRDGELWAWTYAKSQKVRNLERDERATVQVEDGDSYAELRGVMIEARAVIHRDLDVVAEFGVRLFERYADGADGADGAGEADGASEAGGVDDAPGIQEMVRAQAAKRAVLQFVAERTASWDHRKLGGVY